MAGIKGKLGMLGIMAGLLGSGMMGGGANKSDLRPEDIDVTPKKKPIPKGCKEYFYSEDGGCSGVKQHDTVFSCIAMTGRKANEKFERYKKKTLSRSGFDG